MKEYIEREALLDNLRGSHKDLMEIYNGLKFDEERRICSAELNTFMECIMRAKEAPAADVVEVRHRSTDDENCVICNSELDEAEAGGLWDLSAEICNELYGYLNYDDEQDTVYNIIRNYIERQNHCPNCGAKMDGKGEGE